MSDFKKQCNKFLHLGPSHIRMSAVTAGVKGVIVGPKLWPSFGDVHKVHQTHVFKCCSSPEAYQIVPFSPGLSMSPSILSQGVHTNWTSVSETFQDPASSIVWEGQGGGHPTSDWTNTSIQGRKDGVQTSLWIFTFSDTVVPHRRIWVSTVNLTHGIFCALFPMKAFPFP